MRRSIDLSFVQKAAKEAGLLRFCETAKHEGR